MKETPTRVAHTHVSIVSATSKKPPPSPAKSGEPEQVGSISSTKIKMFPEDAAVRQVMWCPFSHVYAVRTL